MAPGCAPGWPCAIGWLCVAPLLWQLVRRLPRLARRPAILVVVLLAASVVLSLLHVAVMFGMRFALDVAFVARDGRVVALYPELPPGGRSRWHREAHAALELPAGTLARTGTRVGDVVEWVRG